MRNPQNWTFLIQKNFPQILLEQNSDAFEFSDFINGKLQKLV